MAFVVQSSTQICRKLQKLEGFGGMNATQPLKVANKLFVNRVREAQKIADKHMKQKVFLQAAASGDSDNILLPHGRERPIGDHHNAATNAPTAKRPGVPPPQEDV